MPSQPQQEQQQNQQQEEQVLQQEQQQQQLQVAAAAAATPASGVAGAAAPAPSTGTLPGPGAVQPVQLPPELGSAVQRALKALADPTPPRPLLAPDLNPAAVLAQQRRLEEADR
jgi:TolA-binding protein